MEMPPARPPRKSRIQQKNRETILAAALEVFSAHGFRGATLDQIAAEAGLSKPNLLYYFSSKEEIHRDLLTGLMTSWLEPLRAMSDQGDPLAEMMGYMRRKLDLSRNFPRESRLFANEILQGAQVVHPLLKTQLRQLVAEKARILDGWIALGKLSAMDTTHFFFTVWSMTQTYADFDIQIAAVLGDDSHSEMAQQRATDHVLRCVWRICGLE